MKALPDNVFLAGQILPEQLEALAGQGIKSLIINRPDMEGGPMQPSSEQIGAAAQEPVSYTHLTLPTTPYV